MDFSYEDNLEHFNSYIENCRKRIKETLFSDEELSKDSHLRNELIQLNKINNNASVSDAIKKHRDALIDIKLNHTMRIVDDVDTMAKKLGTTVDFDKVLKVSALLHDIARFEQAIYASSFNDRECAIFEGKYHAEYGYIMLHDKNGFTNFNIPNKYQNAIGQVVKNHQAKDLTGDMAIRFDSVNELDVNKFLTGNEELNEHEKIIVAALVQMVRDVDMLDILYQHLTGEFPVVRNSVSCKTNGKTLSDIASHYMISEDEIKKFNNLESDDISSKTSLNIPVKNIEPKVFEVPLDIQKSFFNNEPLDLAVLNKREDWSFIVGMWWRLNHFLNSISFVSNMELVEEKNLLENIYNCYPDEYKPLVFPAFEYAKEKLLSKTINENKGNIYIQR